MPKIVGLHRGGLAAYARSRADTDDFTGRAVEGVADPHSPFRRFSAHTTLPNDVSNSLREWYLMRMSCAKAVSYTHLTLPTNREV